MIPARKHYTHNSLKRKWEGFIWMNAPYGLRNGMLDWIDKFIQHANGVTLVPDFTSTEWWQRLAKSCEYILFVCPKIQFLPRTSGQINTLGTTLASIGERERLRFKQPRPTDSECVFEGNRFGPCAEVEPVIPASMRDEAEDRPRSHSPL